MTREERDEALELALDDVPSDEEAAAILREAGIDPAAAIRRTLMGAAVTLGAKASRYRELLEQRPHLQDCLCAWCCEVRDALGE